MIFFLLFLVRSILLLTYERMVHLRYHVKKVLCYIFFWEHLQTIWMNAVCAGNVVSFLWMLSPFTKFYYEGCLLLHYFAIDVVSFYNIYYGCYLLLLQYFTIYVISSFYNILQWMLFPLQYFIWMLSPRLLQFPI